MTLNNSIFHLAASRIGRSLFRLSLVAIGLLSCAIAEAQTDSVGSPMPNTIVLDSLQLRVYFRQNVSRLEPMYRNNDLQLESFVQKIRAALLDSTNYVQDICISSSASPEGPYQHNVVLSKERAEAIRNYLMASLDLPDSVFVLNAIGEDWAGLRSYAIKYNVPYCDEVVRIIDNVPLFTYDKKGKLIDSRKKHLMELRGGKVWKYLLNNVYPELRSGNNNITCYIQKKVPVAVPQYVKEVYTTQVIQSEKGLTPEQERLLHQLDSVLRDTVSASRKAPQKESTKKSRGGYQFALKTNLLYDVLGAWNAEVEFPIGNYVSVLAEYGCPWYVSKDNHRCYQLQFADVELRGWFGNISKRSRLEGWFLGLYYGVGKYDFEWNAKGFQGEYWINAGLSAGYSWKIAENWRLETSLCVGYMRTDNRFYEYNDDIELLIWQRSMHKDWYGPTKAKVSISWLIPMKKNKSAEAEKGGEL